MVQLEATQKSFSLVSVPAGADNVSYWTCKVISQRWWWWEGGIVEGCLGLVPSQSLYDLFSWL